MKTNEIASSDFDEMREKIHRQMLSAVSHDLKTPLATIIGSLEIFVRMEQKLTPEKKNALVNSALLEGYRLDSFITNILDMAKLEGGMVVPKPEYFDLASLLNDTLIRLGPKREKGTITLVPLTANLRVNTDPTLLGRAAGLIIENALKHSGKDPVIAIHYGVEEKAGFIQVYDKGAGIPKGKEKAIFSKYTRLAKSDQQNAGTGLGLAICRDIMKVIDGTVLGENMEGSGARFSLRFSNNLVV